VDTVIGEWVKAEGGEEGIVVAVAHAGGDTAGWQLLILQPNLRLTTASAPAPSLAAGGTGGYHHGSRRVGPRQIVFINPPSVT
jgi:hypothetical protein